MAVSFAAARAGLGELRREFLQPLEVAAEDRMLVQAILQAGQVRLELTRRLRRQFIDHPITRPLDLDQPPRAEIGEMLRDLHLRLAQDLLKVADAERTLRERVQEPQPRAVTQAFVNLQQLHAESI